jgi:hypothetical protein
MDMIPGQAGSGGSFFKASISVGRLGKTEETNELQHFHPPIFSSSGKVVDVLMLGGVAQPKPTSFLKNNASSPSRTGDLEFFSSMLWWT